MDGGAFEGEIINDLLYHKIEMGNLYLFEANLDNYNRMVNNISSYGELDGRLHPERKGLWDKEGTLYLEGEGESCKIVEHETNKSIDVTTIDSVVGNSNIDFIKMDIEGAELPALRGGMSTIIRCRPVLAISIYHSPEDFVGIPIFLYKIVKSYKFRLLHHTNEYVETILYAMPEQ